MPPDDALVQISAVRSEIFQFKQDYERRHGELISRISILETRVNGFASREDVIQLREALNNFRDTISHTGALITQTVEQFETATEAMATRTDVDWLKRAFWAGVGVLAAVAGGLALHMLQTGVH